MFNLMCVHIIFSSVRLLSDHLLVIAAHSVDHMFSLYFDYICICNISYFPFWFSGLDLGSDCFSS